MAGTIAAVITGTLASYVWWAHLASGGDEGDLSWVPGRAASTWTGKWGGANPTLLPRLPNPDSTLGLVPLAVLNGVVAGVAEVRSLVGFGLALLCATRTLMSARAGVRYLGLG